MGDTISNCGKAKDLFGSVQQGSEFLSDSYKRMDLWRNELATAMEGHDKLSRLSKIGNTRWWGKDNALSSVFELPTKIPEIKKSRFIIFLKYLKISGTLLIAKLGEI